MGDAHEGYYEDAMNELDRYDYPDGGCLGAFDRFEHEKETFYEQAGNDWREGDKCPICSGHLRERVNKHTQNVFLGCSNFPRCKKSISYRHTPPSSNEEIPF